MKKMNRIILTVVSVFLIFVVASSLIYLNTYYKALPEALDISEEMEELNGNLYFRGVKDTGIIIYPGGKVDEKAYTPLAKLFYQEGYTVVIAKMPFRLAIMDSSRAGSILDDFDDVDQWIIAGHSLGGTSASMFVGQQPEKITGIVFLGSYPYKDLSDFDGFSVTITGSNDYVLDREKAAEYQDFYPDKSYIYTIDGGNHAGFGSYGEQKGDGVGSITAEQQQQETVELIKSCLL